MITWIQQTFQQHFRSVFLVLLAVVIISFVFITGAVPGIGPAERGPINRPFFGKNLASEADQKRIFGDAELSVFLQIGQPVGGAELQQYALTRHAGLAMADKLGIPASTRTEIEAQIKKSGMFIGENGQFDAKRYADFRERIKKEGRISQADLMRVLSDDLRFEKVQKLLSGPGYVLPAEVKREVTLQDTTWTVGVASIDYASFKPAINPSEAELTKFFEDNQFRYEIPQQVVLSYVEFPAAAYLNQVSVTEPEVRAFYDANPARFPKPNTGATPTVQPVADPSADYALVRPQVEAALRTERAQRLAAKAASEFALQVFERKAALNSSELNNILSAKNLTLKDLPAFGPDNVPAPLRSNPRAADIAFRLNKSRAISEAVATDTGSAVLFWKETIPSRQPAFAEVRAKVAADYAEEEKRKRFMDLGRTLRTQLAARVKNGESFEKAAEAVASANGLKIETKTHSGFTIRQRPQDIEFPVLNALRTLEKGEVSELVRAAGDKGVLVYAADKKLPELSDSNPQYAAMKTQLAQFTAARAGGDYLQELVREELSRSEPKVQ
jgi:peptidyl-prolyl cis-trans isomerase D